MSILFFPREIFRGPQANCCITCECQCHVPLHDCGDRPPIWELSKHRSLPSRLDLHGFLVDRNPLAALELALISLSQNGYFLELHMQSVDLESIIFPRSWTDPTFIQYYHRQFARCNEADECLQRVLGNKREQDKSMFKDLLVIIWHLRAWRWQ